MNLTARHCSIHPAREAAVRCPSCSRFFCRECVTETDGRMLCARCLGENQTQPVSSRRSFVSDWIGPLAGALTGCLLLWTVFYLAGLLIWNIPASYHQNPVLYPEEAAGEE